MSFVKLLEIYPIRRHLIQRISLRKRQQHRKLRSRQKLQKIQIQQNPKVSDTTKEVDTKKPVDKPDPIYVYLSFDASPNEYTEKSLICFYRYNCAATFFLTSEGIKSHPKQVLRMISEGHALGVSTKDGSYNDISTLRDLIASFDSVNNTYAVFQSENSHCTRTWRLCK